MGLGLRSMRLLFAAACLVCLQVGLSAPAASRESASALRAFPGAEGFGAYTPGGRGGKVYVVTTLEDDPESPRPGSFRAAVMASEPRFVVFAVAGTIHLKKKLHIDSPFLTIAGQTAPGGGICIADEETAVATHDVVIRHLRFRRGDTTGAEGDSLWFRSVENVIVDHCSLSWSLDENFSFTKATSRVTAQWCIISEGLNPNHHGYGSLIAPSTNSLMSFHHNLYANNYGRCPRVGSRGRVNFLFDYRNNVLFNWGTGYDWGAWGVYGKEETEGVDINYIGNVSIAGADTSIEATLASGFHPRFELTTEGFRRAALSSHAKSTRIYQSDNRIDSNVNGKLEARDTGWEMVYGVYTRMDKPFAVAPLYAVTTEPADRAYESVLQHAGAWPRDVVDARVVDGVHKQSGRIIRSQSEVGGWPELKALPAPRDTDGDGLPDEWERAHGLDPADPSDASKPAKNGGGYSNIEVYANGLVPVTAGK